MGRSRHADAVEIHHTPKSRRLPDKLSELCLVSPQDARDIEAFVDYALARANGMPMRPRMAKVKRLVPD